MTNEQEKNKIKKPKKELFKKIVAIIILIIFIIFVYSVFSKFMMKSTGSIKMDSMLAPSVQGLSSMNNIGDSIESESLSFKESRSFDKKSKSVSNQIIAPVSQFKEEIIKQDDGGELNSQLIENIKNRKIIKNASLSIVVDNIKKAKEYIENKIIKNNGGYVERSNFSKYQEYQIQRNASLSDKFSQAHYEIRIPSSRFDEVINGLKGIAYRVQNENITSRDVTLEYLDTETSIKVKREALKRLEEILQDKKLNKEMKDVFATMKEIDRVIGEINRYESRLNNLKSQVSMSRISLDLTAKKDVQIGDNTKIWTPSADAKDAYNRLIDKLIVISRDIIYFVIKELPILIIKLLFLYGIYEIFKIFLGKYVIKIWNFMKKFVDKISGKND